MAGVADLIELCCVIIEDIYGSFLAHIFSQLATYGRLQVAQVAQRCRLLPRQAKIGVGALVQLRLLQHHTSSDGVSSYQVNLTNAYNILRIGSLVERARRKCGDLAAVVLESLAARGCTTVQQLQTAVTEAAPHTNGNHHGQNGDSASAKFQSAVRSLVRHDFVERVRPAHVQIPYDVHHSAEASQAPVKAGGKKGEAERTARAQRVEADIERRLDGFVSEDALEHAFNTAGIDKAIEGEEELLLCPNYAYFVNIARDSAVVQDISKTLGKTPSRLMAGILKQIPLQVDRHEPDPNPRQELQAVAMSRLRDDLQDLGHDDIIVQTNGHHDVGSTNGVDTNGLLEDEDIEEGLEGIAEGPYPFFRHDEDTKQWALDKYGLATWVRDRETLRLMRSRVSNIGMRLVRMMIDKGKLDERILLDLGLVHAKEMRQALAQLKSMGFIELQEVPREPHRQPSRTMYLWFFDPIRARNVLLGELYKTMARLYERLQTVERERMKATLEKVERDDVRDRVDEVVSGKEMVELRRFQAMEKWLLAEIGRLDESVALLRDI
ncbi:DNA-directed RNA polymerase III subunit rpc3 [Cyphellophora attinorum]|uniref:DNA-directed RNA polymerase III subunit RPC3 n=1 Tax=Cyphellophora attinorum TaxID=1664694 RepID=A0A0N1H626_9EURO|nr:DNA-directed RNA polymerase III subunit rpc3 [Phialophora attinorum]KPI36662.1 DNA-directed RNA polymerase III subunit rpc3 [Phialophora attinorum]